MTALAFGVGGDAWGWLVLGAFVVTSAAGPAAAFGVRGFVNSLLLDIWFIVAVGFGFNLHEVVHITSCTWAQVLARTGGAALWIAVTFLRWLVRGRTDQSQPFSGLPDDTSRRKLTRRLPPFAVVRAVVIAGTVAPACG